MERIIFHIDVNSAFLSWTAAYRRYHLGERTDLRSLPSAVGGSEEKRHGIILAKSIPAAAFGVRTGESLLEARKKCPQLILVPPDYSLYQQCSDAFQEILREYTDRVEEYSIDECFMDMSDVFCRSRPCRETKEPEQLADVLRCRIRRELGFTVNVGIARNKLLAKMASDLKKPDYTHTLFPWELSEKFWPLPVRSLFLVGGATERKLAALGLRTIGALAHADRNALLLHFKKPGIRLWQYANGIDDAPVVPVQPDNKGYSNSTTLSADISEPAAASLVLLSLSETIGRRLRKDGVYVRTIGVSIRYADLRYASQQTTLPDATDLTNVLHQTAYSLLLKLWNGAPMRQLGIYTSGVTKEHYDQFSLFSGVPSYEKQKRADCMADRIRERFGRSAVMRGAFAANRFAPMSGGTPEDRRHADYKREELL